MKQNKDEIILILKNTVNQLNNVIEKINQESVTNLPEQNVVSNLVQNTNELLNSLDSQTATIKPQINSDKQANLIQESPPKAKLKNSRKKAKKASFMAKILTLIKSFLFNPFIVIGIFILAIALYFFPNLEIFKQVKEAFNKTVSEEIKIVEKPAELNITEETKPNDNALEKQAEKQLENQVKSEDDNQLENEIKEEVKITETHPELPELITPEESALKEEIILTPESGLTPEQNLIASIQNQVLEITQKYADGLISKINANFGSGDLTITINDSWYEITENQQDKLAQEVFKKAQKLDFYKIKIIDNQSNLIARNPIVGNEIIILRRY